MIAFYNPMQYLNFYYYPF